MNEKKRLMLKIEEIERALIDLNKWTERESEISRFTEDITGPVENLEQKNRMVNLLKTSILSVRSEKKELDSDKMYLTEIVTKEKPKFGKNNLILAPVGSGKSFFIKYLINSKDVLLLVSTTSLKDKLVPRSESERLKLGSRMYSTKHKEIYGKGDYSILVMTYSEFGSKIKHMDDFALGFPQIFCDEIHSLPHYLEFSDSNALGAALKYLVLTHEGQEKYYFTATKEHLDSLERNVKGMLRQIEVFDYLNHPDIKKYMPLSSYSITGIEQVRSHLRARKESFKYFDYKALAFSKSISSLIRLGKISEEEGFKPLLLWSINNKEHVLTEEQKESREYVLATGLIPDKYDILIINSAMQEGWDLIDPRVKLAIMNTTNETELVQATGRVRQDIDVLVYRVNSGESDCIVDLPTEMLGVYLDVKKKAKLSEIIDIYDENNRRIKWTTLKLILQKQGFLVEDKTIREDGKQKRVSIISVDR